MLNPRGLFLLGHAADAGIDIARTLSGTYGFSGLGAGISIATGLIGQSDRGRLVPTAVSTTTGVVGGMSAGVGASMLTKGILAKSTMPFVASKFATGLISGGVGMAVEMVADAAIRKKILPLANYVKDQGKRYDRFYESNYVDTNRNYTMRQEASYQLNQSLLNARQYLATEGQLFHQ